MIDFKEISSRGDKWELFARDFLIEKGYFIESPPDRGPDAGKDMLITEHLKGKLNNYQFRWLVSCKHKARSGKSVTEKDEPNILDRVSSFKADGFIGFYSTIPSSGLNKRLSALRDDKKIKDYHVFDHKEIESFLVTSGYSHLLMRYLPKSYKLIKPIHLILDDYQPLNCRVCNRDILMALFEPNYDANMVQVYKWDKKNDVNYIQDVYCACSYKCDGVMEQRLNKMHLLSGWRSISDLVIPISFLHYVTATMNRLRDGDDVYTDDAFKKEKDILIALAQKVLRSTTERERERFKLLMSLPG